MKIMICRHCGRTFSSDLRYCTVCGRELDQIGIGTQSPIDGSENRQESSPAERQHRPWIRIIVGFLLGGVIVCLLLLAGSREKPVTYNQVINTVTFDPFSHEISFINEAGTPIASIGDNCAQNMMHALAGSSLVADNIEMLEQFSRIRLLEYEAEMELSDGPCVGKYIVISNESDWDMDAEAVFRFYDERGEYIDELTSYAYGISAGGRGIVFG